MNFNPWTKLKTLISTYYLSEFKPLSYHGWCQFFTRLMQSLTLASMFVQVGMVPRNAQLFTVSWWSYLGHTTSPYLQESLQAFDISRLALAVIPFTSVPASFQIVSDIDITSGPYTRNEIQDIVYVCIVPYVQAIAISSHFPKDIRNSGIPRASSFPGVGSARELYLVERGDLSCEPRLSGLSIHKESLIVPSRRFQIWISQEQEPPDLDDPIGSRPSYYSSVRDWQGDLFILLVFFSASSLLTL